MRNTNDAEGAAPESFDPFELCAWAAKNSPIVALCAQRMDLDNNEQKMLAIGLLAKENERLKAEVLELRMSNTPAVIMTTEQQVWPEPQKHPAPAHVHLLSRANGDHVVEFDGVRVFDSREVEVRGDRAFRRAYSKPLPDFKNHCSYKLIPATRAIVPGEVVQFPDGRAGIAMGLCCGADVAAEGVEITVSSAAPSADLYWCGARAARAFKEKFLEHLLGDSVSLEADPPAASPGELPDSIDEDGRSWRDRGSLL